MSHMYSLAPVAFEAFLVISLAQNLHDFTYNHKQ